MDYQTRKKLSHQELKWYYQGKMLNDADELGLYDEYLKWLTICRDLDDLKEMSDFFDSALSHIEAQPKNEARRIITKDHVKECLT